MGCCQLICLRLGCCQFLRLGLGCCQLLPLGHCCCQHLRLGLLCCCKLICLSLRCFSRCLCDVDIRSKLDAYERRLRLGNPATDPDKKKASNQVSAEKNPPTYVNCKLAPSCRKVGEGKLKWTRPDEWTDKDADDPSKPKEERPMKPTPTLGKSKRD